MCNVRGRTFPVIPVVPSTFPCALPPEVGWLGIVGTLMAGLVGFVGLVICVWAAMAIF